MRAALLSLVFVAWAAGAAGASDDVVGVVVVADATLQPKISAYLEHWLEHHKRRVLAAPLSADATNTLTNCLVIDDQKCARAAVEARAKSDAILFVRAELTKDHSFVLAAYWFAKGHEPITERRVCEHCGEDTWQSIADQLMDGLSAQLVVSGHLHLESQPTGLTVLIDNIQVGLTPLDRDLPAGHHRVDLLHAGRHVGRRNVAIDPHETTELEIQADLDHDVGSDGGGDGGSRIGPGILVASGFVTIGTGAVFLYYGSLGGPSQKYTYPNATPVGIAVMAAGVGAALIGSVLFVQAGHPRSTPVAAVTHDGAYVGWMTHF